MARLRIIVIVASAAIVGCSESAEIGGDEKDAQLAELETRSAALKSAAEEAAAAAAAPDVSEEEEARLREKLMSLQKEHAEVKGQVKDRTKELLSLAGDKKPITREGVQAALDEAKKLYGEFKDQEQGGSQGQEEMAGKLDGLQKMLTDLGLPGVSDFEGVSKSGNLEQNDIQQIMEQLKVGRKARQGAGDARMKRADSCLRSAVRKAADTGMLQDTVLSTLRRFGELPGETPLELGEAAKSPLVQGMAICIGETTDTAEVFGSKAEEGKKGEGAVMALAVGAPHVYTALKEAAAARIHAREGSQKKSSIEQASSPPVKPAQNWLMPLAALGGVIGGMVLLVMRVMAMQQPIANEKIKKKKK